MWYKWRPIFKWESLCPIIFADPLGLVVIMPRAEQPVTQKDAHEAYIYYYPNITAETKASDFGQIGKRVFALDYGLPDRDMVSRQRAYYKNNPNKPAQKFEK